MDVDTCRALAAAVLGDADKVEFLKTTTQTRFTVLQTGEVDVTAANATWTLTRDAKLGIDFVTPTFYDGQGFMVSKKLGVKSVKEMNDATVCVLPGSTSEKVAAEVAQGQRHHLQDGGDREPEGTQHRLLQWPLRRARADHLGARRQPLCGSRRSRRVRHPARRSRQGPHGPGGPPGRRRSGATSSTGWCSPLFEAEEKGVTSKNVDDMLKSNDEAIQRLLGVKGELGKDLGLDAQWAYRIVKQVGNYGEIFERNVGKASPMKMDRGLNDLWTRGGLLYSPPFN